MTFSNDLDQSRTGGMRWNSLDVLKFICAIQIICGHFENHCSSRLGFFSFHDSQFGRTDVLELFFLISGFLFANGIVRTRCKSFGMFIWAKIRRFYPTILLTVALEIIVVLLYYFISGELIYEFQLWQIVLSFLNITRTGIFIMPTVVVNTYLWYIEMLLLCDSIMFFFVWKSKKDANCYVLAFLMLIIGIISMSNGFDLPLLNFYTSRAYIGFFLGVLLWRFYDMISWNERAIKLLSVISLMMIIIWIVLDFILPEAIDNIYFSEVFMLFPAIFFLSLNLNKYISASVVTSFLSEMSFQIYVWQSLAFTIREILGRKFPIIFTESFIAMYIFVICIFLWALLYMVLKKKLIKFYRLKFARGCM